VIGYESEDGAVAICKELLTNRGKQSLGESSRAGRAQVLCWIGLKESKQIADLSAF
jgi:hypothetical protein